MCLAGPSWHLVMGAGGEECLLLMRGSADAMGNPLTTFQLLVSGWYDMMIWVMRDMPIWPRQDPGETIIPIKHQAYQSDLLEVD